MVRKIIPDDLWAEMRLKHINDGLTSGQISRLLEKRYGIYVSRQAVWWRLDNDRRKLPELTKC